MQYLTPLLALGAVASAAVLPRDPTSKYVLKTRVQAGQEGKDSFDGLYLEAYHTGAGLNDATFNATTSTAAVGYLNATSSDSTLINQLFDLGTTYPFAMIMAESAGEYTSWEPVRINTAAGSTSQEAVGFSIDADKGLLWNSDPSGTGASNEFGGWLVCDWWHNVPQLFFFLQYENAVQDVIATCARVDLVPQYLP